MRTETGFSEVPEMLSAFAPEFRQEHYHLHGRSIENWESFKSVFLDEHHGPNSLAIKVFKGAAVGAFYGFFARQFLIRGPKSFELDRLWLLNKASPNHLPFRGYAAFGGVMGAAWWLIKDVVCLPHGFDTEDRHLLAYGLMGGVLMSTIVHPVNFVYGFIVGLIAGKIKLSASSRALPRGMQWKMKNADQQKRRIALRQDEEYELSMRNSLTTRTNLYPL